MSHQTQGWAITYSPYTGTVFQVHQGIAEIANDTYDYEFFMSLPRFAQKIRVSERSCQRALRRLVRDGFLEVVREADPATYRPTTYRFLMPEVAAVYQPPRHHVTPPGDKMAPPLVTGRHQSGDAMAPRSQVEPKREPKGGAKPRRWRVVPPATELTSDRKQMAEREGLSATDGGRQIEAEWRKFTRHEFSSPRSDIDRTWRNWCAKEAEWKRTESEADPNKDKRRAAVLASQADYQQRLQASRAKRREPSAPTRLGDVLKDVGL
jgi:hypothetical protein